MLKPSTPGTRSQRPRNAASKGVRRWLAVSTVLPFGYAFFGLLALAAPGYEVFPFFSWFLFPITPSSVTRWAVRLEQLDGHELGEPTWYEEERRLGPSRHSMDAQMLIQALGEAVERASPERVHQVRLTFERNFLVEPCKYALVKQHYDPLERWIAPERTPSATLPQAVFECAKP